MHIRWTRPAVRDLTRIGDHSAIHFGAARAQRTVIQLSETVAMLADFPGLGRIGRKPNTFELVISGLPFVAVYRIKDNVVEVIRILHGAQKWP